MKIPDDLKDYARFVTRAEAAALNALDRRAARLGAEIAARQLESRQNAEERARIVTAVKARTPKP